MSEAEDKAWSEHIAAHIEHNVPYGQPIFEAGMAAAQAVSQPDRDALAETVYAVLDGRFSMSWPWAKRIADAVLAALSPAPLTINRESLAETLSRSRHPMRWEYAATSNIQSEDYAQADAVLAALSTQPAAGEVEGYVALRDLIDECMDDALHDSEMTPAELLSTVVWDHGYRRADQGEVLERQPSPELAELFPGTLAALDHLSIRPEVQS